MRRLSTLTIVVWMAVACLALLPSTVGTQSNQPQEALAGFDDDTNDFVDQATHEADMEVFAEQELVADGLGPVFNAQSCGECHQNPVTGSSSQIAEQRAGRLVNGNFVDHPGDSLIHSRATNAAIQERIQGNNPVRSFRMSLSVLGDGYVEAIANSTLEDIADDQRTTYERSGSEDRRSTCRSARPRGRRESAVSVTRISRPACFRSQATPI